MIPPADPSPLYPLFALESPESTATSNVSYGLGARKPTPRDARMSKLPDDCPQLIQLAACRLELHARRVTITEVRMLDGCFKRRKRLQ